MPKINELYEEIDNLNKKIDDESKNHQKRIYLIDDKIERLEEEKRRAGFNKDPLSVQKFHTKILQLKEDRKRDYLSEFKSQIENCEKQISEIVFDYYKSNVLIEDIFKIEDVPKDIQEELLDMSDFGQNTGYLFVDMIDDGSNNWSYFNPIMNIKIQSKTLKDLKSKVISEGDYFLSFDDELAGKSEKRDLEICQGMIGFKISHLHTSHLYKIDEAMLFFKGYADKFSENQLVKLSRFICNNFRYFQDFSYILDHNEDKYDESFFEEIHRNLIDEGLDKLEEATSEELKFIFDCFEEYSYKFSEKQIMRLYGFFTDYYVRPDFHHVFKGILDINDDKFDESFFNEIYTGLIDDGIGELNNQNLDNDNASDIFASLKIYVDKFSKDQFERLCHIVNYNMRLYDFADHFNHIVKFCTDKFGVSSEKIHVDLIDCRLNELKRIDTFDNFSINIFHVLKDYAGNFDEGQLMELCRIVVDNPNIHGFKKDFDEILGQNSDKLESDGSDEITEKIIDAKLKMLKSSDEELVSRKLFGDLMDYAKKFNDEQIKQFCRIIDEKEFIGIFDDYILTILSVNKRDISDKYVKLIYKLRIDSKLDQLEALTFGFTEAKRILGYLEDYSEEFDKKQITRLCDIALTNYQVYGCWICSDRLKRIITVNKDKIDSYLFEKVVEKNGL